MLTTNTIALDAEPTAASMETMLEIIKAVQAKPKTCFYTSVLFPPDSMVSIETDDEVLLCIGQGVWDKMMESAPTHIVAPSMFGVPMGSIEVIDIDNRPDERARVLGIYAKRLFGDAQ